MKKEFCGRMNKIGNYSEGCCRNSPKKGCKLATGEGKLYKEVYYVDALEIFHIRKKECPVVWSEKIENLTGYDLSDPESILELSLALRLNKFMNH